MKPRLPSKYDAQLSRICHTRLVCSRTVKGRSGDTTITIEVTPPPHQDAWDASEASLVARLVGYEVDVKAHEQAAASGVIDKQYATDAILSLHRNYALLLSQDTAEDEKA